MNRNDSVMCDAHFEMEMRLFDGNKLPNQI